MAAPFISLGLKATDYIADNHLHKLDDKYFHYSNYKPNNVAKVVPNPLKKTKKRKTVAAQDGSDDEEDEVDSPVEEQDERYGSIPRDSGLGRVAMARPPPGTDIEYSREPPRVRDRYIPPAVLAASAGVNAPYYPPPPSYSNGDTYETPISRQRRPRVVSRRSSSHPGHGARGRYYESEDSDSGSADSATEMQKRKSKYFGSHASGSAHVDRARERAHRYGLKGDFKDSFTDSKAGLAGGAVGAVVGGWAASKAQVAFDKKGRTESNALIVLLGAAVGGLSVNAVVDRFEDNKKETREKERGWEEDFNDDGDSRTGNRSAKSSGRDTRRNRRGRDRGYESGYD